MSCANFSSMADMLQQHVVGAEKLSILHYIPDYLSEDEEQRLLTEVHASQGKWVQLSGRRLQNHGGIVHAKGLIPAPMPRWLEQLSQRIHQQLPLYGDQGPNHVLINSYEPGCGIMPHQDGPLYHPVVCILSLGSPAVLRFWRKQPEGGTGGLPPVASILAMPRSLLVFQDDAYHDCLHGIEEVTEELLDSSLVNLDAVALTLQQEHHQGHQQQQTAAAAAAEPKPTTTAAAAAVTVGPQAELPASAAGAVAKLAPTRVAAATGAVDHPGESQTPAAAAAAAAAISAAANTAAAETPVQQGNCCCCCCSDKSNKISSASTGCTSNSTVVLPTTIPRSGERISLTIRRVLRVHKALGILKR